MKSAIILSTLALVFLTSCGESTSHQNMADILDAKTRTMKENFKRYISEAWNKKDLLAFRDITVENYIRNINGITVANRQNEMEANMNLYFNGFPDTNITTEEIVLTEDHLFAQWTFSGTNTGVFGESPPTGKKVSVSGSVTLEFDQDGKMMREDVFYNELELLQQLGYTLVPPVLE